MKNVIGFLLFLIVISVAADNTQTAEKLPRMRPLTNLKFERTAERLQSGKYLTEGLLQCFICHSDRDWKKPGAPPIASKKGGGSVFVDEKDIFVAAPNITPDKETGAGTWTDDMLARAIWEGIGHDGRALHPGMWYQSFKNLSNEEVASIVVYLRSIPPVHNAVPKRRLSAEREEQIKHQPEPITAPVPSQDSKDRVLHGEYLVRVADCEGCHTSWYSKVNPGFFAGGNLIERNGRKVFSVNLTPDPSGIPYYNDDLFIEVMRTGKLRGAREISPIMPWIVYSNLTDADLRAIFAFLKTLPPLPHAIDNDSPPTLCKLCGQTHGGGERNKPLSIRAVKVDPKLLDQYQGEYRFADGFVEKLVCDGDHLVEFGFGGTKDSLMATSDTQFYRPDFGGPMQFFRDASGRVAYVKEFSAYDPGMKIK